MSAGCLVVGSATLLVQEVIEHEKNGLLVDFSESWKSTLHIGLALVTFVMVIFIQHVQHRETRSMQIKLEIDGYKF